MIKKIGEIKSGMRKSLDSASVTWWAMTVVTLPETLPRA